MWRNWSHYALLVGMYNGAATVEKRIVVPQKVNHRISIRPRNWTPRYIPTATESRDSNRFLYTNVHRCIVHKS